MQIKGLTISQLELCASKIGIQLYDARINNDYVLCRLQLKSEQYRKYKGTRKVWAVCWHGYRDFFIEVYKVNEDSIIDTMFAKYNSLEHFYYTYPETGNINVGSKMNPIPHNKACQCYPRTGDIMTELDIMAVLNL